MTPAKFLIIAIGAISIAWTASAENEATYTPDGRLHIPHLNRLDAAGDPIASYKVTMQKESDQWKFSVTGQTDLPFSIPEPGHGSILNSSGRMYIPHALLLNTQGQTIRNYAVYMRKDSQGRFSIYGLTDLGATVEDDDSDDSTDDSDDSTDDSGDSTDSGGDTNDTTTVSTTNLADVAGTWDFYFAPTYDKTFTGSEFGRTTNMAPAATMIVTLTLEQMDEDVTGTGTANSVEYTVSGQVSGDLFSFSMLAGYSTLDMGLLSAHVVVDDTGEMDGDYYSSKTNGLASIEFGKATSVKQ